jgi:hypothetical protein
MAAPASLWPLPDQGLKRLPVLHPRLPSIPWVREGPEIELVSFIIAPIASRHLD